MKEVHDGQKRKKPFSNCNKMFKCYICNKKMSRKDSIQIHIKQVHEDARPFQCSTCDEKFKLLGALTAHKKVVPKGIKPFHCDICQYKCASKRDLRIHKEKKHDKK